MLGVFEGEAPDLEQNKNVNSVLLWFCMVVKGCVHLFFSFVTHCGLATIEKLGGAILWRNTVV